VSPRWPFWSRCQSHFPWIGEHLRLGGTPLSPHPSRGMFSEAKHLSLRPITRVGEHLRWRGRPLSPHQSRGICPEARQLSLRPSPRVGKHLHWRDDLPPRVWETLRRKKSGHYHCMFPLRTEALVAGAIGTPAAAGRPHRSRTRVTGTGRIGKGDIVKDRSSATSFVCKCLSESGMEDHRMPVKTRTRSRENQPPWKNRREYSV